MLLTFAVIYQLRRKGAVAALLALALVPTVQGQAPLLADRAGVLNVEQRLLFDWQVDAADSALNAGLALLAESVYRDLLAETGVSTDNVADLQIQLAASLIAQRRFEEAGLALQAVPEEARRDLYYLYLGVSTYGNGRKVDQETLTQALSNVAESALKPENLPWLYVLRGLQAELVGRADQVAAAFQQASEAAVSEAQRAFFTGLILREEILRAPASEVLATEVRGRFEGLRGTAAAYPYLREYAVILHNQGRDAEAIELIAGELANVRSGYASREREQLLLLKGLLYGVDTLSGRDALRGLLREGKNREVMAVALQLLARASSPLERDELTMFLNVMVAEPEPHPLLGQIYYIRSQLALAVGETALAEADARLLLEQFPGLSEITNVYRLLAYAALQRTPAQYRAAADFLIQLRDQAGDVAARQVLNRLIGDCYFLNTDYRNAVDFYQAARFKGVGVDHDGEFFLRLVTAKVRAGDIDAASELIDEADFSGSISVSDRWRAEWNVAQALQASGELALALKRVRLLLAEDGNGSVPIALDLRFRWLEARLSLVVGTAEPVRARVDTLLTRIESLPAGASDPSAAELRLLRTEVLLLQGDILIGLGDSTAGMQVLRGLRTSFAESSAAERSYLSEANYFASIDDFAAAQQTLLKLASQYEASELAAQALFEAALYCERQGPQFFPEAVRVHHDLTERYPQNKLFFSSRLKQGDLLRQMNNFAGAQVIYENLIRLFPEHPRRYVAELSRADCMLALAKNDAVQLKNVAQVLERLIDLPNLPIDFQAEVGYKWGFTLLQHEAFDQAQVVFTLIVSRFLLDGENAIRLGETGRYWMSRTLLELGSRLEAQGQLAEARRVYRKMVAYNLPGRTLAQSRADRLPVVEE